MVTLKRFLVPNRFTMVTWKEIPRTNSAYDGNLKEIPRTNSVYDGNLKEISRTNSVYDGNRKEISRTNSVYDGNRKEIPRTNSVYDGNLKEIPRTNSAYDGNPLYHRRDLTYISRQSECNVCRFITDVYFCYVCTKYSCIEVKNILVKENKEWRSHRIVSQLLNIASTIMNKRKTKREIFINVPVLNIYTIVWMHCC